MHVIVVTRSCVQFVGGNGLTLEDPDPISAVASKETVSSSTDTFITRFVV